MTPHAIKTACASTWGVTERELAQSRRRRPSEARFAAIYLCREALGMTYVQLAAEFGRAINAIGRAVVLVEAMHEYDIGFIRRMGEAARRISR